MSMISAQCDELRELAGDGSMEWVTGPIRASILRDAADTIWELRGALQVASADYRHLQAENDKLRERCRYLMKGDLLHVLTDQEYIDQCERERLMQVSIDALDKENVKLRELVAQRTAKRVVVSNAGTDHATGHCECGACGGAIDPFDTYCRHCGAELEDE